MNHLLRLVVLVLTAACCLAARVSRVTRGSAARPHEFKSIIHIQVALRRNNFMRWCGGTLLNSRTVLTAAHCQAPGSQMRVFAGVDRVSAIPRTRGVVSANVVRQIPHRRFSGRTMSHDIMILKLDRDIIESRTIEYARLPLVQGQYPPAGTACTLAGWGMTAPNGRGADELRKGPMTAVIDNPRNSPPGMQNDRSFIFARPAGPTQTSACKGDSGGPLYCPANDGGKPFQVGAVSGGDGYFCGSRQGLGRFSRVSYVLNWIRGEM